MAKKRKTNGKTKSEMIRTILVTDPTLAAKEVVAKLKESSVDATEGLVYAVKQKMKADAAKTKTRKRAETLTTPSAANGTPGIGASIAAAKTAADKVGGWATLKEIVDAMQ